MRDAVPTLDVLEESVLEHERAIVLVTHRRLLLDRVSNGIPALHRLSCATMSEWNIAQLNVARARAETDSPVLADFMAALDRINALADTAPGFVWRLQSESGNATDIRPSDDPLFLVNMSVWSSVDALFEFVYKTAHTQVMARRREWFEAPVEAYQVLWWIPAGHVPTVDEALERLAHLRTHGPSPHAFTFKQRYPSSGQSGEPVDMQPEPYCGVAHDSFPLGDAGVGP